MKRERACTTIVPQEYTIIFAFIILYKKKEGNLAFSWCRDNSVEIIEMRDFKKDNSHTIQLTHVKNTEIYLNVFKVV